MPLVRATIARTTPPELPVDPDQPNRFQRLLGPVMISGLLVLFGLVFLPMESSHRRLAAFWVLVGLVLLGFAGIVVHLVRGVVPQRGRWLVRAREPGAFWFAWALQAAADLLCLAFLLAMTPMVL